MPTKRSTIYGLIGLGAIVIIFLASWWLMRPSFFSDPELQSPNATASTLNPPKEASNLESSSKASDTSSPSAIVSNDKVEKIVLATPIASVSNPLIRMVESGALDGVAKEVELRFWRDPNQMRAMVLNNEVNFIAMPSNVAASLYNKEVDLQLLNVSVWGILHVVSSDAKLSRLSQLTGKTLVVPFRGDMPDIILRQLLAAQQIKPEDLQINYVSNPMVAVKMLMTKKADYALLAEPAVSMALLKSSQQPANMIAPTLYRSIDIQKEWGTAFDTQDKIPQAGMAVVRPDQLDPKVIDAFVEEYANATTWVNEHPQQAGELVAKQINMLAPKAVADAVVHAKLDAVTAQSAKPELKFFYEQLANQNPALIGGSLPDEGFYYTN